MSAPDIGIVIPTMFEAKDILRRLRFKYQEHSLYRSEMNGRTVYLAISGVGRPAARRAAERLVSLGAKELVSMGFCGALLPDMKVGSLVTHRIVTVDKAVSTPEERQKLTERANAVAVDMETQAIIEEGTRQGVPIRILRVVSDEFTDDMRPLFGENGSFHWWKIALRLLNPKVWPLAGKLKKQSAVARSRLVSALVDFAKQDQ